MNIKCIIASFFKVLAVTLTLAVLLPSAVKLSHVFNHHEHEVCSNDDVNTNTHFHELDLDCEFYKFKLNTNYYFNVEITEISSQANFYKLNSDFYLYLRAHEQDTSYLRGPPTLS